MRFQTKRTLQLIVFILGIVPITLIACQKKVDLSFDTLFPKSTFETVLDASMQVLGEIEQVHVKGEIERSFDCINDIIVGKLFHIRVCVENFHEQIPQIQEEDLEYLSKLLGKISCEYKKIFTFRVKRAKSGYVFELIKNIQSRLEDMLL